MSDQTVEERAGAMGWVPQEKFRGDPEKWVDAETFVQRGEQVMPILKHNNEKLQAEIASLKGELGKVTSLFQASQEAVEELKKFNSEATRRAAE
ncbi:MAG: hypothetical protein KGL39_55425, partial [Patescibacteria group bacterium]|nr:hypothetical protein [Patescibacteria group bacterium]